MEFIKNTFKSGSCAVKSLNFCANLLNVLTDEQGDPKKQSEKTTKPRKHSQRFKKCKSLQVLHTGTRGKKNQFSFYKYSFFSGVCRRNDVMPCQLR